MILILFSSFTELDELDVADALKWAFLILPNFCLGQGIGDLFNNYNALDVFHTVVNACVVNYHLPKHVCENLCLELGGNRYT